MENYRESIEEKLDNVILQHSYSRNREKRVDSEYVEFVDWLVEELDRAREEGIKDGMRGMIDILCEKGCGSMFAVIKEKDVNKKIKELSKLTTK